MIGPVKSTDPRKMLIVQGFKDIFGVNKVTMVLEIAEGIFTANCMYSEGRKYHSIGGRCIRRIPGGVGMWRFEEVKNETN